MIFQTFQNMNKNNDFVSFDAEDLIFLKTPNKGKFL